MFNSGAESFLPSPKCYLDCFHISGLPNTANQVEPQGLVGVRLFAVSPQRHFPGRSEDAEQGTGRLERLQPDQ